MRNRRDQRWPEEEARAAGEARRRGIQVAAEAMNSTVV
jgi:hypothetical protein